MTDLELKDEQLEQVQGGLGHKTGDTTGTPGSEDYAVYLKFPLIASSFSGFYTRSALEALADQFVAYASLIQSQISDTERNAVLKLYGNDTSIIPVNVKTLLGI